ncbi:hypothetical protein ACFVUS_24220 [Nocardia sp. NPDC058058]|uniref:hypothetical protein n=1 Tax=Nocardia sp. NPDC058058 TaxID=3346317 RepID=UPI0036DB4865
MQDVSPSGVELCLRTAANYVVAAGLVWSNHRLRAMDLDDMQDRLSVLDASGGDVVRRLVWELRGEELSSGDRTDLYRVGSLFEHAVDRLATAGRVARDYGLVVLSDELCVLIDLVVDCAWITAQSLPPLGVSGVVRPYWVEVGDLAVRAEVAFDVLSARHPVDSIFLSANGAIRAIGTELLAAIRNLDSAGRTMELLISRRDAALVSPRPFSGLATRGPASGSRVCTAAIDITWI